MRLTHCLACTAVLAISLSVIGVFSAEALAQPVQSVDASDSPQFDVASVKPNVSGDSATSGTQTPGSFSMINETLQRVIGEAYADVTPVPSQGAVEVLVIDHVERPTAN